MLAAIGASSSSLSLRKLLPAASLATCLLFASASLAQQPGTNQFDAHTPTAVDENSTRLMVEPPPASPAPEVHRFWDRENILLFSGVAIFRGLDYASTRNMQARGRKEILLAPEVVNNDAAFASLEAAGTMTSI